MHGLHTTHRVIHGVHHHAAVARTAAEPTLTTCLAGAFEAVVDIRHDAYRSTASYEYHTSLARGQLDDGEFALTSQQLGVRTGGTSMAAPWPG